MNWNCAVRNEDEASSLVASNAEALRRVSGSMAPDPPLAVVRNAPYVRFLRVRAGEVRAVAVPDRPPGGDVDGAGPPGDGNVDGWDDGGPALDDGPADGSGGGHRSMLEEADLAGGRRTTGTVRLAVRPERDEGYHDVGSLQELPSEMRGKVPLRRMGRAAARGIGVGSSGDGGSADDRLATFIDYGHLLSEAGSSLKPRIRGPYMARLRRHLISVRAALDEVEKWLDVSDEDAGFLERTTGAAEGLRARLEGGTDGPGGERECVCPPGFHEDTEPCSGCGREYGAHSGARRTCPGGDDHDGDGSDGGSGPNGRRSDGPSNGESNGCIEKDDDEGGPDVFRCKSRWVLLREFRNVPLDLLPDRTRTDVTFRLSNDEDRTRLAELVSSCADYT